jgi:hypothetical protein
MAQKLNLTRDQLASFLQDFEQIRQFERLFATVDQVQEASDTTGISIEAGIASSTANDALAQIIRLAQDIAVNSDNKGVQALDSFARISNIIDMLALSPRAELGTISSQNKDNVDITGGEISGLTTPLPVASGGTGGATAATARANLGVTATGADTTYAFRANNLSDLASAATARTNLGLGTIAVKNIGVSGSFTTVDLKTVTVTDGIITSIV